MMIVVMTLMMVVTMTEVLTYKELAERLNIKVASARRLVMRKKWSKVKGNDGETRINVPLEALDRPNDTHDDNRNDGHHEVRELQMRVQHLQELLEVEKKRATAAELDRDRWHELAIRPWWRRLAG